MKYLVSTEKKNQARITYSAVLFFESERKIQTFSDKQNFKKLVTSRSGLQEMLKEVFYSKEKLYRSEY